MKSQSKEQLMDHIRHTLHLMSQLSGNPQLYDILDIRLKRLKNEYVHAGGKVTDKPFGKIAHHGGNK